MAESAAIAKLCGQVEGLSLGAVTQVYPNVHPHTNPLDLWRVHISNVLSKISGVETSIIYPVVSWTSSLDKGDFSLPVPALRIKGQKPDALGKEWVDKVRATWELAFTTTC
jgi:arginyl-tRNA synthetase